MAVSVIIVMVLVALVTSYPFDAEFQSRSLTSLFSNRMASLEKKVKTLEEQVPRIAFSATGSQLDIHPNSHITFGNVKTNYGGCYNPTSSIFTCKDKALYLFYVTITAYTGSGYGKVWYQIVQDGHVRVGGVTGSGQGVGTHFAMVRCYPGSHIWVKQGHNPIPGQGMWQGHSQFGGFQIAS